MARYCIQHGYSVTTYIFCTLKPWTENVRSQGADLGRTKNEKKKNLDLTAYTCRQQRNLLARVSLALR